MWRSLFFSCACSHSLLCCRHFFNTIQINLNFGYSHTPDREHYNYGINERKNTTSFLACERILFAKRCYVFSLDSLEIATNCLCKMKDRKAPPKKMNTALMCKLSADVQA